MTNFAALTLTELAPILTLFGGMLVGFYGLVRFILSQSQKSTEADRLERQQLAEAIKAMADPNVNGNARIANGIERQADESKERNGHLGDQSIKIIELITNSNVQLLDAINNVSEQHVDKQVIEKQEVKR